MTMFAGFFVLSCCLRTELAVREPSSPPRELDNDQIADIDGTTLMCPCGLTREGRACGDNNGRLLIAFKRSATPSSQPLLFPLSASNTFPIV
jgi:hypothetical protein